MAVLTIMPLYVANELHGSNALVGMATTMFTVSAVVVRPFMGYLLDTMDRRVIFLIALFAMAASHVSNLLISGFVVLYFLRFLHGVPWGAAQTASSTIAADLVPASRRGEGLGYFGLTFTFAGAIGPFASLALLEISNFATVFAAAGVLGLCALALAFMTRAPVIHHPKIPFHVKNIIEFRVGWIAFATLLTTTSWGIILSFIALYSHQLDLPHPGLYFTLDAAGTFISRFRAGYLFDRYGPRWLLLGGYTMLFLSILLLGISPTPGGYIASALLLGAGYGILVPVFMAMTINLIEASRRGAATATLFSSFDIGVGLGAIVFGLVAQYTNFQIMWLTESIVLVFPPLLFLVYIVPRYEARLVHTNVSG